MEGTGSVADEESDPSEADSCREVGSAVSDSGDSDSEDISGFESCSEHSGEAAVNAALIDNDDGEQSSDEEQEPESNEQADGARCSLCEASIDLAPEALVALPDKWCDGVCDRELPRREMRYRCPRGCDFDICTACAGAGRAAAAVGAAATAEAASAEAAALVPPRTRSGPPARSPGPVASLVDLAEQRRQRHLSRQHQQLSSMNAFIEWQAARAAARHAEAAAAAPPAVPHAARPEAPTDEGARTGADAADAALHASPSTGYALPAPPAFPPPVADAAQLRRQVAELLSGGNASRKRAIEFAREVFRQLPSADLSDAALRGFGSPNVRGIDDERNEDVAATPPTAGHAGSASPPARFEVQLRTNPPLPLGIVTYQEPCSCCDDNVGTGVAGQCAALQLLSTLDAEMEERDRIIEQEMGDPEGDGDYEQGHRSARFFMYRAFVAAQYGYLGAGNRVRIPLCVVAAIRARYRAPGCDCPTRNLATCSAHGYVGHKDR